MTFLFLHQRVFAAEPENTSRLGVVRSVADPSIVDPSIVDLVNSIRQDPVSYAVELGYDRKMLLEKRPWLVQLLAHKLPLLKRVSFLDERARLLNSPVAEGKPRKPSLANDYARTGEFGGVVSFPPVMGTQPDFQTFQSALKIVVDNRFKSELANDFQGERCILGEAFDLAGAAVEEAPGNICYITALFGSSVLKSRRQILNLINQVRADPAGAGTYLLFPLGFSDEYPPLFFENLLQKIVTPQAMVWDGETPGTVFGYGEARAHQSTAIEVFPKSNVNDMVFWIFSSLVLNEAKGLTGGDVVGSTFNQAGIHLMVVNGRMQDHVLVTLAAGSGFGENPMGYSRVYGLVYADGNQDGAYTPGEGAKNRWVSIHGVDDSGNSDGFSTVKAGVWTGVTDNTGHFLATLLSHKQYIIRTGSMEDRVERELFLMKDHFVALTVGNE
jgi:hypothetical protein